MYLVTKSRALRRIQSPLLNPNINSVCTTNDIGLGEADESAHTLNSGPVLTDSPAVLHQPHFHFLCSVLKPSVCFGAVVPSPPQGPHACLDVPLL